MRMAASNSKDLLQLEANSSATSCLESKLVVRKRESQAPLQKPSIFPVPRSRVLGKVMDFIGVMSESNEKLLHDAKDNPDNYDIEVLSGKESQFIEMDLMLGVADLHTPEAVAAAESAMASYRPAIPLSVSSSESESEDSSDGDDNNKDDKVKKQGCKAGSESVKFGSKDAGGDSSCKKLRRQKQRPNKRSKIVELS